MEISRSYEIEVRIGGEMKTAFLQNGFLKDSEVVSRVHDHHYTEIHVIYGGRAVFKFGDECVEVSSGEALAIPAGMFHVCALVDDGSFRSAFQVDAEIDGIRKCELPKPLLDGFFSEAAHTIDELDQVKIAGYIQIICAEIMPERGVRVRKVAEVAFIIHEFVSTNYVLDARLSDLAESLCLSEKQTARLVELYTGKTFKQAILERRMNMAKYLIEQGGMSFSAIGEYLGYQSYGGFYKAYTKYYGERCGLTLPPSSEE